MLGFPALRLMARVLMNGQIGVLENGERTRNQGSLLAFSAPSSSI